MLTSSLAGSDYIHAFGLPVSEVCYTEMPHYRRYADREESEDAYASRLAQSLDDLITEQGAETVACFIADLVMSAGG